MNEKSTINNTFLVDSTTCPLQINLFHVSVANAFQSQDNCSHTFFLMTVLCEIMYQGAEVLIFLYRAQKQVHMSETEFHREEFICADNFPKMNTLEELKCI